MPRCLTVTPHLPQHDLAAHYRHARNPVERSHWHIVWLVASGHHCPAVARLTGYSEDWVRTIVHRYNADGPAAMADRRLHSAGHPPLLSPAMRADLRAALAEPPSDGGLWTGPKVAAWMTDHLDRPVGPQRGWEAIRALGFTPQRPRPRATKADPVAQAAFQKKGAPGPDRRGEGRASHRPTHGLGRG